MTETKLPIYESIIEANAIAARAAKNLKALSDALAMVAGGTPVKIPARDAAQRMRDESIRLVGWAEELDTLIARYNREIRDGKEYAP